MQNIAAYTLISQYNETKLSTVDMKKKIIELLSAIEAPLCEESLDLFLSNVEGKSFEEVLADGSELMKSQMSTGASNTNTESNTATAAAAVVEEEPSESSEAINDFF